MTGTGVQDCRFLISQALQFDLGLFDLRLQRFNVGYHVQYLSFDNLQFRAMGSHGFEDYRPFFVGSRPIGFEQCREN